tara:strand:+ start:216 stop:422 length:207 start_codon:yes stop_codon:yes gene_type:complete
MDIMYWFFIGMPAVGLFLKIKNKEFEDPMLFVFLISWIVGVTLLWFYMDWFDPDFSPSNYIPQTIWKN